MDKWKRTTGVIGVVVFIFGMLSYLFTLSFSIFVKLHLLASVILLSIYIYYNSSSLKELFFHRALRRSIPAFIYALLIVAIITIVNMISNRHYLRWDLTEASIHTLSDQSQKVLRSIDRDIRIYAFVKDEGRGRFSEILDMYAYASSHIKCNLIDPEKRPDLAEKYGVDQYGSIVIEKDSQWVKITDLSEESITNAIKGVLSKGEKVVYFLEGHGERGFLDESTANGYGSAKRALEGENYRVNKLFIPEAKGIPSDCSLLIIAGPQRDLLQEEINAIDEYLNRGGSVFFLIDPHIRSSFSEYIEKWGVTIGDDIIVDRVLRLFAGPALGVDIVINRFEDHPITKGMRERVLLSLARSVDIKSGSDKGITRAIIARTSPSSWAERDVRRVFERGEARLDSKDRKGPIPVAVAVEREGKEKRKARIVCVGDTDFASNRFISIFFNRDFFVNICNWLLSEEEYISIRPKMLRSSNLDLTQTQGDILFYGSVLFLPEIFLIIGFIVWHSRR